MQMHDLRLRTQLKRKRRIGRGGKRGTYSGRGIKGMGARAGAKKRPAEREILKKIPKLRGYRFKRFREKPGIVNLGIVGASFREGETVSPETLIQKGLVRRIKGKMPRVKILGRGKLGKELSFKNVVFSHSALREVGLTNSKFKNQNSK